MFDHELILIEMITQKNDIGDSIQLENRTAVLCDVESITRSEHYAAQATGLQPEIVFKVNKHEYSGQSDVEFEGKRYIVLRSYEPKRPKVFDTLELICEGGHIHG